MKKGSNYEQEYFQHSKSLDELKKVRDFAVILKLLNPQPGEKILDIGCGLGRLSYPIAKLGAEVTGIDISDYAISQANQRHESVRNLDFVRMDALEMKYESCFDKVLCYHVLEHLKLAESHILLSKIYEALNDWGVLVVGIPINDFKPYRRAIRLLTTGWQWREPTHQVSFSLSDIEAEITDAGFHITNACPLSYFGTRLPNKLFSIPGIGEMLQACADIRAVKGD